MLLAGCGQVASPVADKERTKPTAAPAGLAPAGYVTDAANILDPKERTLLADRLSAFEARTRHQLVVVTVPSLHGQDIADFARDLGNRWGVGRKGINDGVTILVAPNERKVRIAVGLGLERLLTDAFCQEVIDREMAPSFAKGAIDEGLAKGAAAIMAKLPGS